MKKIAIATCVLLGLTSTAQAGGDPAIGQEKSAICGACHGADGNSTVPTFPKLAGQSENYLTKQLKSFKDGTRKDKDGVMSAQAAGLDEADIPHLAAYFASQKATPNAVSDAELAAQGQKLFMGGNAATGVVACAACHGPTGSGNPAAGFPALGGQHAMYVITQLQSFQSGGRTNEMMNGSVAHMTDDEMKAVAEYISGLH
jgi:cytochrome c553